MKAVLIALVLLSVHFSQQQIVKSLSPEDDEEGRNDGEKQQEPSPTPMTPNIPLSKPVVCYEREREDVRSRLIAWLKSQDETQGVEGYNNLLRRYFDKLDKNNDTKLDAMEFLELIETNSTVEEALSGSEDEYISPIVRGLCIDALIAAADLDNDWKLTFHEFSRCLNPDFKPPRKGCELEGKMYDDGAEFPTDCNSCVCACGHWVCTVLNCEGGEVTMKSGNSSSQDTQFVVVGEKAEKQLIKEMEKEDSSEKVQPLRKLKHNKHNEKQKELVQGEARADDEQEEEESDEEKE